MTDEPAAGRLLVATPDLLDPNFATTVVLLIEHNDDGSAGLVLNRPSSMTVEEALDGAPQMGMTGSHPPIVFVGGPVQPQAAAILARMAEPETVENIEPIMGDVGIVTLHPDGTPSVDRFTAYRVFAGYAGWGNGQLEGEIANGGWFVVDGLPEDVFTTDVDTLWHRVLRRQGGIFRTATHTPSWN